MITHSFHSDRTSFFTVPQIAEQLGVSTTTIYNVIRRHRLKVIKVNGRYIVPSSAANKIYRIYRKYSGKSTRRK